MMSSPTKEFLVITTGGTIDALPRVEDEPYLFPKRSFIPQMLDVLGVLDHCVIKQLPPIDSKFAKDEDRARIIQTIEKSRLDKVLVTHGTDSIVETSHAIAAEKFDKVIGLTGAFIPYSEHGLLDKDGKPIVSDAPLNVGYALGRLQSLPHGTYVLMNADTITHDNAVKDTKMERFRTYRELSLLPHAEDVLRGIGGLSYTA